MNPYQELRNLNIVLCKQRIARAKKQVIESPSIGTMKNLKALRAQLHKMENKR